MQGNIGHGTPDCVWVECYGKVGRLPVQEPFKIYYNNERLDPTAFERICTGKDFKNWRLSCWWVAVMCAQGLLWNLILAPIFFSICLLALKPRSGKFTNLQ